MHTIALHQTVFAAPNELLVSVGGFTGVGSLLNDLTVFIKTHGIFRNQVHIVCGGVVRSVVKTVAVGEVSVLCSYSCSGLVHKVNKCVGAAHNKLCKNKSRVVAGTDYKVVEQLVRSENIAGEHAAQNYAAVAVVIKIILHGHIICALCIPATRGINVLNYDDGGHNLGELQRVHTLL